MKNIAHSVHDRLANIARSEGRAFQEVLNFYVIERFLYRLSVSPYADIFVLKGALMFRVWNPAPRATKDIDLLGQLDSDPERLEEVIREVCLVSSFPDGLEFDTGTLSYDRITHGARHPGSRFKVLVRLDRAEVNLQIDVGFGNAISPAPVEFEYPVLLDMPAPRLKGYQMETLIAEKLDAFVRRGEASSRVRDFYDICYLSTNFFFDGSILLDAVTSTFSRRDTAIPDDPGYLLAAYSSDPARQVQWSAFTRSKGLVEAPQDFGAIVKAVSFFVAPILHAASSGTEFDKRWDPASGWM
jgi:predicted nucleotidyltransferase component of viral defense system